jgi:hypothetical protein
MKSASSHDVINSVPTARRSDEASSLLSDSDGHRLAQFVHKSR